MYAILKLKSRMWTEPGSYILIFILAIIVVFALRSSTLLQTPGRDGGIYAYIGSRIAEGEVLYRDIWDHKTPLIHYFNAALFLITGPSFTAMAVVEILWLGIAAVVMYALVYGIFKSQFTSVFTTLLFIIYSGTLKIIEYHGMTETYAMLPALLAVWAMFKYVKSNNTRWIIISGVLISAAFGFRQTAAVIGLPVTVLFVCHSFARRLPIKTSLAHYGIFLSSIVFSITGVFLIFYLMGAGPNMISQVFGYNAVYAQEVTGSLYSGLQVLLTSSLGKFPFLLASSSLGILSGFLLYMNKALRKSLNSDVLIFFVVGVTWFVIDLWAISISGRYYEHYFFQLIPSLAFLAAFFFFLWPHRKTNVLAVLTILFIATGWMYSPVKTDIANQREFWDLYSTAINEEDKYIARYQSQKGKMLSWMRTVPENEAVYFWGAEAELHVEGGHDPSQKYSFVYPLHAAGYSNPEIIQEFISSLAAKNPLYIVDASGTDYSIARISDGQITSANNISREAEVAPIVAYIREHYTAVETIERWVVYKRDQL